MKNQTLVKVIDTGEAIELENVIENKILDPIYVISEPPKTPRVSREPMIPPNSICNC
jgi:hypothetical protein